MGSRRVALMSQEGKPIRSMFFFLFLISTPRSNANDIKQLVNLKVYETVFPLHFNNIAKLVDIKILPNLLEDTKNVVVNDVTETPIAYVTVKMIYKPEIKTVVNLDPCVIQDKAHR